MRRRRCNRQTRVPDGFTLLEMLLVCLIIVIMATVGLPRLMTQRLAPEQGAQVVYSTLMYAQRLAVTEQRNVVVTFDLPESAARVHLDADHDGEVDPGERVMRVLLGDAVRYGTGGAEPRSGDTPPVMFEEGPAGLPAVTFLRSGSASSAGSVYVTARNAGAADTRMIAVERATGRATIHRPSGGAWVPLGRS